MTNRRDFIGLAACGGAAMLAGKTSAQGMANTKDFSLGYGRMIQHWSGLKEEVKVWIVGDTHFGLWDERDAQYANYYHRMCFKQETYAKDFDDYEKGFAKTLNAAKAAKIDLLLLAGDIISAPTLANVEYVTKHLNASGLNWLYTAGNHDWHFEGDSGSDAEQRERWIERRLKPFYRPGVDPLMYSVVMKGVRFVMIDDSDYLMLPKQLEFWKAEAAKGDPMVLVMHIPLWTESWGICTVGCPYWGAKNDPYYKIERRQRWAAHPNAETIAFREAVLATPNLVGVFTGHEHTLLVARERGQNLISVPRNTPHQSERIELTLKP